MDNTSVIEGGIPSVVAANSLPSLLPTCKNSFDQSLDNHCDAKNTSSSMSTVYLRQKVTCDSSESCDVTSPDSTVEEMQNAVASSDSEGDRVLLMEPDFGVTTSESTGTGAVLEHGNDSEGDIVVLLERDFSAATAEAAGTGTFRNMLEPATTTRLLQELLNKDVETSTGVIETCGEESGKAEQMTKENSSMVMCDTMVSSSLSENIDRDSIPAICGAEQNISVADIDASHLDWRGEEKSQSSVIEEEMEQQTMLEKDSVSVAMLEKDSVFAAMQANDSGSVAMLEKDSGSVATLEKDSVSVATLEKDSVSVAMLENDSVSVATLEKDSVSVATLEKDSVSVAMLEKDSVSVAMLEKDSVFAAMQANDSGSVAMLEKDSGSVATLEKDSVSVATLEKDSVSVATLEKDSVSVAMLEKDSGSVATLEKDSVSVATLEKDSVSVAMLEKDSVSVAVLKKASGYLPMAEKVYESLAELEKVSGSITMMEEDSESLSTPPSMDTRDTGEVSQCGAQGCMDSSEGRQGDDVEVSASGDGGGMEVEECGGVEESSRIKDDEEEISKDVKRESGVTDECGEQSDVTGGCGEESDVTGGCGEESHVTGGCCQETDVTGRCGQLPEPVEAEDCRASMARSGDGSRESSVESEHKVEVQRLRGMAEQQRYLRLQHLLKQSNIYSKFLLQRMEVQRLEKDSVEQKRRGRKKKVTTQDNKSPSVTRERVTRSGSLKSPPMMSFPPSADKVKPASRRGKKRKSGADSNSDFDISQFMDGQGKLKQMKLTVGKSKKTTSVAGSSKMTNVLKLDDEEMDERYFEGSVIPVNQPRLVTGGLMRSYQLDGMEWLKSLYENGVNGILGDEMGLGKTLQCIAFIAYLIEQGVKGPFLVAAPLSTIPNWVAEFKRFSPNIPVVLYHGTQQEREDIRRKMFANSRVGKFSKSRKSGGDKSSQGAAELLLPVVVTSYDMCMRDQRFLENRKWKFLVVDEGHRIKNLNCKLIRSLKSYDASNRLLLTGTPLQNNLAELWSLLNFLLPNIFNDLDSFQSLFDFDMRSGSDAHERIIAQEKEQHVLGTLHQILTPFLLRRLKTDVEFSLPPKKEILVYAPLTSYQEKYYKSLLDRTVFQMMEAERNKNGQVEAMAEGSLEDKKGRSIRRRKYKSLSEEKFESVMEGEADLEEIMTEEKKQEERKKHSAVDIKMTSVFVMLRKCVNHPYLLEFPLTEEGEFHVDEQLVSCCGKMMLLDKMLSALLREGHKVLIFSQFTRMLDVLEDYLDLRGLDRGRLDGSMAFADREQQMTKFKENPKCMIFLLSTRAGGLGINLTAADTVIIYDSDWNPQCDLQAQDRCHRIGQTHPVMVYRLVTANTIDQRIVERAATKRRLEKMVIHKGKFKGLSSQCDISVDDLIDLLHSVDHDKVVNNQDAVISDKALAALLDRTMNNEQEGPSIKDASITEQAVTNHYQDNFKVIAERDGRGNLIRSDIVGEESVDTVDSLAIKQDLQAMDSGCEVASSSSLFSTSPEPFSSEDGLKSNSSSSFFSCDSNALGPSTSPPVMKPMQQDATQESY